MPNATASILHIDDDPAILKITNILLSRTGFSVNSLHTPDLDAIGAWTDYNLVILDWILPNHTGEEMCQMARDAHYEGPIIVLSSKSMTIEDRKKLALHNAHYMTKPFGPSDLIQRVREVLAGGV